MAEPTSAAQGALFLGLPVSVTSAFVGGIVSGALVFAAAWLTQRREGERLATRLAEERDAEREARERELRRAAYVEALKHYDGRMQKMVTRIAKPVTEHGESENYEGSGNLQLFAPMRTLRRAVQLDSAMDRLDALTYVRADELRALDQAVYQWSQSISEHRDRHRQLLDQAALAARQQQHEAANIALNEARLVMDQWRQALDAHPRVTRQALKARIDSLEEAVSGLEALQPDLVSLLSAMRSDIGVAGHETELLAVVEERSASAVLVIQELLQHVRGRLRDLLDEPEDDVPNPEP